MTTQVINKTEIKIDVAQETSKFTIRIVMTMAALIGIWAVLQVFFAYIGPAYGAVAWAAHVAGFLFGVVFALLSRHAIGQRLRRLKGY